MFGDVPLALGTNYKVNEALSRSPKVQVYQQMITDMKDAQNLLSDHYLDGKLQNSAARVRPTRWAAGALLARVYLYTGDWANAETEASSIINNSLLYQLEALDNVFNVSSQEAIWQLQSVVAGHGTEEAYLFILPSSGTSSDNPVYLSSSLLSSIETNDQRKIKWISSVTPPSNPTYFYPFKYQENTLASGSATQYLTVFRLAEQYLIRAEAQAQGAGGGLPGAINDLNAIRNRAELPAYSGPSNNKDSVLAAILHERRIELFSEFGHRWLDLKRTGTVDAVMSVNTPMKTNGLPWKSYQQLYPIPIGEIQKDPNLVQNPGYPQ